MQASEVNRAEYFTFARPGKRGILSCKFCRESAAPATPFGSAIDASLISLLKPGDLAATKGGHIRV